MAVLEQEIRDDRDRVNCLEAHDGVLNRKLDTLIDLLSNQFLKIDGVKSPVTGDPNRVEEKESEVDNHGLGSACLSQPLQEGDDFPNFVEKIQMPNFSGLDPLGWLARVEQYFQINHTVDLLKLQLALVCMEGTTLHWVPWLEDHSSNLSWPQFCKQLLWHYADKIKAYRYVFLAATKSQAQLTCTFVSLRRGQRKLKDSLMSST